MSAAGSGRVYCFAEFELDPYRRQLRRGGEVISLQRQPMSVLLELVDRPGQLVTRQELYDSIWGDTVVEFDQALNYAIRQVRAALAGSEERFIETVRGKGYRFVAPVRVDSIGALPRSGGLRGRWVLIAAGVAAVALSIGALLTSSRADGPKTAISVGEGEADGAGEYLARGHHFFRRNAMERDVAQAIRMYEAAAQVDPTSAEAFAWLAISRFALAWDWNRQSDVDEAEASLRNAVTLAPEAPTTELALGYADYTAGRYEEAIGRLVELSARVPEEAAVLVPIAYAHRRLWNHREALEYLERAFELDSGSYEIAIGIGATAHALRDWELAERYYDWCIALAPDEPMAYVLKGWARLGSGGDLDGLVQALNEGGARGNVARAVAQIPGLSRILSDYPLEWSPPPESDLLDDRAEYLIGWGDWAAGRGDGALGRGLMLQAVSLLDSATDTASARRVSREGRRALLLGMAQAGLGLSGPALLQVERGLTQVGDDGFTRPWALMWAARAAGTVGEMERAEKWLAEMLNANGPFGLSFITSDPLWRSAEGRRVVSRVMGTVGQR